MVDLHWLLLVYLYICFYLGFMLAGGPADLRCGECDEANLGHLGVAAAAQESCHQHQPGRHGDGLCGRVLLQPRQVPGEPAAAEPAADRPQGVHRICLRRQTAPATALAKPFHTGQSKSMWKFLNYFFFKLKSLFVVLGFL